MLLAAGFGVFLSARPAAGQEDVVAPIDVLQVSGFLDPVMSRGIERAITNANANGAQALILQVNLRGTVVSRSKVEALASMMKASKVPIVAWVGPSGARAYGAGGQLVAAADISGMAPGARVGRFGDPISVDGVPLSLGEAATATRTKTLGATDARSLGLIRPPKGIEQTAVIGEMIVALDGAEVKGLTLATAEELTRDGVLGRAPTAQTRFSKLGLIDQLFHSVASPPVTYLLLAIGLGLLLFEFFTAGVGVAGVIGAVCTMLACYGLGVLPARWWAVGLILASMIAFAVDVQAGVPRFWTGAGVVMFVLGSFGLYRGISLSWVPLGTAFAGVLLTFLSGMPSMVRTRFATPTIGREWMIGATGTAVRDLNPEGVVQVAEGTWRALTNRATPVKAGDEVRVVAIDGVTLEVEPLTGGARDYRERKPSATVESIEHETTEQ